MPSMPPRLLLLRHAVTKHADQPPQARSRNHDGRHEAAPNLKVAVTVGLDSVNPTNQPAPILPVMHIEVGSEHVGGRGGVGTRRRKVASRAGRHARHSAAPARPRQSNPPRRLDRGRA